MDEPTKFLADRLLSQERPITYRELSRALNVHVNTAKGLLYDFNKNQNAKRAGSIHATYLLSGVKSLKAPVEEADEVPSSSAPESLTKPPPTMTLTLVGEEKLEDILREYREVTSIHIYSLAASRQTDVAVLADIANSVSEALKDESPSDTSKYGTITNPLVRRRRNPRTSLGGSSKPVRQGRPAQVIKAEKEETLSEASSNDAANPTRRNSTPKAVPQGKSQSEKNQTIKSEKQGSAEPSANASKAVPTTKRSNSGSIMQSFAKAAAKPRSKPKTPVKEETPAALSDDGEADDSDVLPPSSKRSSAAAMDAAMKRKKDRADELKRMMEEDDDDEDDDDDDDDEPDAKDSPADEDQEMVDVAEPKPEEKVAEEVASSGNGRRRGRRRVMKKKRILDEQGYMVTIQEAGWESFSEEDSTPQPPAKKPTPSSTPSSTTGTAKGKKATGKGNIMSFFSKK
ncbi:hypothetical protein CP533_5590 [Ophiocordyceps camponoti-saundersi (nom. inval.)]|nr:hypothetical protein CP533_5590 [Ophiocordyceps camponoti-saundersi (nom. inval.)]